MKINMLLQKTAKHFVLLTALSAAAIATDAQTASKTVFHLKNDTTRETSTDPSIGIQVLRGDGHQKFELHISNPSAEKLNITISGPEGVGFSDQTRSAIYHKRINMSEAQDGNYTITVVCNKKTISKTISLQTTTTVNRDLNIMEVR